jgi:hypothetical protein
LGKILGRFFTNSSGHPERWQKPQMYIMYFLSIPTQEARNEKPASGRGGFLFNAESRTGLPDFFLVCDTKTGKNYQMNTKFTKL